MAVYAVGDIQGCSAAFDTLLKALHFQPSRDRLWLVGDLVNRGPDSLGVLRRVIELGRSVTCVLGNHDLHLLATVAGGRELSPADTFAAVLAAPDARRLVDWLRRRPLLHYDAPARRVLVHAGVPPFWTLTQARRAAREVEHALRGPKWRFALRDMYGNQPSKWSNKLDRTSKRRYTINALTRMRYCDKHGRLDFNESGPPGSQRKGLMPWFEVPDRPTDNLQIVFGHWAALGLLRRADITALDSGCVWGGSLTAVRLDKPARPIRVNCAGMAFRPD
ncbi:MAG TPA: symmetrical bis(5'-nucleosyl)-tetraphosphatase [Gammaproteobacteria bacterium]|nr:symmetrical bis(5'-nucleosyl)-tetraphosphatase [Gammaproteobacteria bacterium]